MPLSLLPLGFHKLPHMRLKILGVFGALFLRLDVFPAFGMPILEMECNRLPVHRDFLKFAIHPLLGKLVHMQDITNHILQNFVLNRDVPASPAAVPRPNLCAVFQLCTLAPKILAALSTFDKARKLIEPAPVGIGGLVFMKLTPCGSAFLCPPVRLGSGFPLLF